MRTLFTSIFILALAVISTAQTADVSYVNGRFVNTDGTFFSGMYTEYSDGIKVSQLTVNNGLLNGQAFYFFADGTVKLKGNFKFGKKEGQWIEYNNMGQITTISNYQEGQKHGKWEIWDDEGNKRFEMYYENGQKIGTWKMWNESGELTTKVYGQ